MSDFRIGDSNNIMDEATSYQENPDVEVVKLEQHHELAKADTAKANKKPRYKNTVHLWEFLLELLSDERYNSLIAWSRKEHGEFKLKNQEEVAKRWGILKHRAGMNYEKLSRAIRYYYQQGIIQKVPGQRLVYKFGKLPYEFKPRIDRANVKAENTQVTPVPFQQTLKAELPSFLPLTSLTPPPEAGYPYPVLPTLSPPVYNYCYDYRFSPCSATKLHGSPLMFPNTCGYTAFSTLSQLQRHTPSPPRSIPVSVITCTHT